MDFVLKISNDYETIETQIMNPENLDWGKELKSTGDLNFTITINDPQIQYVVQYKKIALYVVEEGSDVLEWSGYISDLDIDLDVIRVKCFDEKKFMEKKILFADKTWAAEPIANILSELASDANSRSSGVRGNLTSTTDLSDNVTKDYSKGTKYSVILDEIADLLDAEWDVVLNEIRMYDTIGTDRTVSGADFIEFVSNIYSPNENTITEYRQLRSGRDIATSVIGKDSTTESTATYNTSEFGHVEQLQSFSGDSSLADQTTAFVQESGVSQGYTEITIDADRIDFRDVAIGDLVAVRVERDNALIDIDDSVKILGKRVTIEDRVAKTSFQFGDIKKSIPSPQNFMANLKKDIDTLKLQ